MATTAQAPPTSLPQPAPQPAPLPWLQIGWFTGLLLALYFSVFQPMVDEWSTQEEMGHGFFVPVLSAYIVWLKRAELAATPVKTFWPAILLVFWGFAQTLIGIRGAEFSVSRTGVFLSIIGVIWTLCGTEILKKLALPLFLLLFAIRIPLFIYSQITQPLQMFASQVAEVVLSGIGIPCLRNGNVLELPNARLQVVEACSGIRSLISLTFLSVVYGYFFERRMWLRIALFFLTIPIAIIANAGRVTITGILYQYKREWAEGVYHTMEGWVIFMVALAVLIAVHGAIAGAASRFEGKKA